MRRISLLSSSFLAFSVLLSSAALAQSPAPANQNQSRPRPSSVPQAPIVAETPEAIRLLRSQGVHLVALGGVGGGVEGYLAEAPGGRMQVIYITPDGNTLITGIAFSAQGENLTGRQLDEMRSRMEGDRARLDETRRQAEEQARQAEARAAEVAAQNEALAAIRDQIGTAPALAPNAPANPAAGSLTPGMVNRMTRPAATPTANVDISRHAYPGDASALFAAADALPSLRIGVDHAPVVYMVADPQCIYCHETWATLRPRVLAGEIQLRVILIGGLEGSRDRVISLLSRPDAALAWVRGEGSTAGVPVAPPPPRNSPEFARGADFADQNIRFILAHRIAQTPWLAYRGRDGRPYAKTGSDGIAEFLSLLPAPTAPAPSLPSR